jgi:hypothetical protein
MRMGRPAGDDEVAIGKRSVGSSRQRVGAVLALVVCCLAAGTFSALGAGESRAPVKAKHRRGRAGSPVSPSWRGDGHKVVLAFGGDVHFEGAVGDRLADDPATALDGSVRRLLSGANLSMVNFESALTDGGCPDPQPKAFVFHAPPSALTAFKAAHVSLVTEANNHGEDCGLAGLYQSLAIARRAHYPVIGIGYNAAQAYRPYRAVVHGQRIAIFAATQVLDPDLATAWTATAHHAGLASAYQESELLDAVRAARRSSDTVVVYLHWGTET